MRYLKTYKIFESDREIDDRLEFEIGDEVWVNEYGWKGIPCQVMNIKVGTDVCGSPHNEIQVYFYYVRNSETEEVEPFRSFFLSKISEVNESNAFTEIQSIMNDINDICDDARDDGFVVEVKPDNEIHMKLIGLYRKMSIASKKSAEPISATFTKDEFSISEIKDTIDRLVGYMSSENFDCEIHYVSLLASRAASVSMRRPMSKKISYEELNSYLSNPDDFTFSDEYFLHLVFISKLKEVRLTFDVDPLYILDIINSRKD